MPCDSSHMQATHKEVASKEIAAHLCYIIKALGKKPTKDIKDAAKNYYGNLQNLDKWTELLCQICGDLDKEQQNKYIYDGRNKEARALADWWEDHQEQDARRKKNKELLKLTSQEKKNFVDRIDDFMKTKEGAEVARRFLNRSDNKNVKNK